jgi:hypothetical protein
VNSGWFISPPSHNWIKLMSMYITSENEIIGKNLESENEKMKKMWK